MKKVIALLLMLIAVVNIYSHKKVLRISGMHYAAFQQNVDLPIPEQDFAVISLGSNCQPGLYTRFFKIRRYAFPLDWCLTPYVSLYNVLENDFFDFFKKGNLVPGTSDHIAPFLVDFYQQFNYDQAQVLDTRYGIGFRHDFINNKVETIAREHAKHYAKYMRRIERFYTEINSGKHIYFIRFLNITKQQTIELCQLIKRKFPTLSFTLIAIGKEIDEFDIDWNMSNIKNYYGTHFNETFWKNVCDDIVTGKLKHSMSWSENTAESD